MNCPKCNKPMKVMQVIDDRILVKDIHYQEVIGRCEACDFDGTWQKIWKPLTIVPQEFDLKQYFFG